MVSQSVFRRCLTELDIETARVAWDAAFPHLPALGSDEDVIVMLHYARTQSCFVEFKLRAWSHRWLTERCYPSGLPDFMRPRAERIYPVMIDAVGIATKTRTPLANAIRGAMGDAVEECYADGHNEPEIVKPRMMEARAKILRS